MPGLSSYTMNAHRNIRGSNYSRLAPLPPFPALLCHAPAQGADLSRMHHPDSWVLGAQVIQSVGSNSRRLEGRRRGTTGVYSPIPSPLSHGSGSDGAPLGPGLWPRGHDSSASVGTDL